MVELGYAPGSRRARRPPARRGLLGRGDHRRQRRTVPGTEDRSGPVLRTDHVPHQGPSGPQRWDSADGFWASGEPKYLNTQETPIFHKSRNLYAIDVAKNEIVKAASAIVVEGYTDVIAMHEAGVKNVVATLGTALTRQHVKLLSRFTKRIVYLFDADEAGMRAAERAAEFIDVSIGSEGEAIDLAVAVIPDSRDPADFVARKAQARCEGRWSPPSR